MSYLYRSHREILLQTTHMLQQEVTHPLSLNKPPARLFICYRREKHRIIQEKQGNWAWREGFSWKLSSTIFEYFMLDALLGSSSECFPGFHDHHRLCEKS